MSDNEEQETKSEETKKKQVKDDMIDLANNDFSQEFLASEGLGTTSSVSKEQFEELKRKNEEWTKTHPDQARSSDGIKSDKQDEKTGDEKQSGLRKMEEVQLVSGETQVDEDWVARYEASLKKYAEEHNQEWKRELKDEQGNDIEGLKGNIGDAEFRFTAPDKAAVNIEGVEALINLAKENGQEVAFNENWSEEFKNKIMETCEKMGVKVQGAPEKQVENDNEQTEEKTEEQGQNGQNAEEKTEEQGKNGQNTEENVGDENLETKEIFGKERLTESAAYTCANLAANPRLKARTEKEIAELEKAGAKLGKEDLNSEKLALKKYGLALQEGDKNKIDDYEKVMFMYDLAVSHKTDKDGTKAIKVEPLAEFERRSYEKTGKRMNGGYLDAASFAAQRLRDQEKEEQGGKSSPSHGRTAKNQNKGRE